MTRERLHFTREYFGLTGLLKRHHRSVQALYDCYLVSPPPSRPAIVDAILIRLRLHLAVEDDVRLRIIRNSGPQGPDLTESTIVEYEDIQAKFR